MEHDFDFHYMVFKENRRSRAIAPLGNVYREMPQGIEIYGVTVSCTEVYLQFYNLYTEVFYKNYFPFRKLCIKRTINDSRLEKGQHPGRVRGGPNTTT